jgi:Tol biopolymer transport system component
MTAFDRFDRVFADVLTDVAQPIYPDYIDDVLERATRGSQRPAWTFPERWIPMSSIARATPFAPGMPWRALGIVALVALLAAGLVAIYIGTQQRLAPPYGPARNGQIVYMADGDIYARDQVDGPARLLVGGDTLDVYPFFSRDGSNVAFFRIDREGTETTPELARLFVAGPDGSGARALFGPTSFVDAAWSPTGDELAIVDELDGARRLSIVDVATGAARRIEFDGEPTGRILWRPPDGGELVFQGTTGFTTSFIAVPADGGDARVLSGGHHIAPTDNVVLTPDGKTLFYTSFSSTVNVVMLDLETGELKTYGRNLPDLGPGYVHNGNVQLSADGSKVIFGRYWDEDQGAQLMNHQVWAASIEGDGSDGVPIGPVLRTQSGRNPLLVLLAPDGTQVLVHHLETEDTWVTDSAGGGEREVDWGSFFDTDWQRLAP